MAAGLSLAEREARRQRIRDAAADRAELMNMTMRCQFLAHDLNHPGHRFCQGESAGGAGCLCRCHDNPGAEILEG